MIQRTHFVLRPDDQGNWVIQNDADHEPHGVDLVTGIQYDPDGLRVYFNPVFTKVGTIQVTTDDDWAGSVVASAGMGTQACKIQLRVWPLVRGIDRPIDPKKIWDELRNHPKTGGNLWVNVTGTV